MTWLDGVRAFFGMGPRRVTFSETAPRPIDTAIREIMDTIGRVSRAEALSIPAVKKGRDLICGVASLPLHTVDAGRNVVTTELLDGNIDPNVADIVTLAQTIEDLLFEGISYWLKTAYDAFGYPVEARHLDYSTVSVQPPTSGPIHPLPSGVDPRSVYWVEGRPIARTSIIVFHSPNTPLLRDASRPIKRALALDRAAELYAENPRPQDFFTPADPTVDPVSDDKVTEALDQWAFWRRRRTTGYVPAALKYNQVQQPTPVDLQLVQLQERAALDIAVAIGLNPNDVGVNVTTRTYANVVDARQDRINDLLAPYAGAVTSRLSMDDVTWPGRTVAFEFDAYLRADPKTRAEVDDMRLANGTITIDEVRIAEGRPSLPPPVRPVAAPIVATVGDPVREIEAA